MKLLLDTQILLWAASGELPPDASRYIEDASNTLLFSTASIWEVVIKNGLGRADFITDPVLLYSELIRAGYVELNITGRHVLFVSNLPMLHKDPFDRLLLAQAAFECVPLLTSDDTLAQYPGSLIIIKR